MSISTSETKKSESQRRIPSVAELNKFSEGDCGCGSYPITSKDKKCLSWLNLRAGAVHFLLSCFFIGFTAWYWGEGKSFKGINTATYVAVPNFVPKEEKTSDGRTRYKIGFVDSKLVTANDSYVIPILAPLFTLLTAGFHFALCSEKKIWGWQLGRKADYERRLQQGTNLYRWVEYSITASIMLVIVTFSLGLRDFTGLVGIVFLNFLIMIVGACIEHFNATKNKSAAWGLTVAAWLSYAAAWFCVWYCFKLSIDSLSVARNSELLTPAQKEEFEEFETFIYVGTIAIFVFFTCFGFVQFCQTWRSKKYESGEFNPAYWEKWYIGLSFGSKAVLIALLFWGLYGRSSAN